MGFHSLRIVIALAAGLPIAANAACDGPRCPPIMPRLHDASDLDKQLAACNSHAVWKLTPTWHDGFEAGCRKLFAAYLETETGAKAKAAAEKNDKDLAVVKAIEDTPVSLTVEQKAKLGMPPAPAAPAALRARAPVAPGARPAALSSIEIGPADADEFREIVNTVGAKDQPLLIRWFSKLLGRQQAIEAAKAAAAAKEPAE